MKKTLMLLTCLCIIFTGCSPVETSCDHFFKTVSKEYNNNQNTLISEDDDFIYILDQYRYIKKLSKKDNTVSQIFSADESNKEEVRCFECKGDRIYILTNQYKLISIDKNGRDLIQFDSEIDKNTVLDTNEMSYLYKDNLYFIIDGKTYLITDNPLGLELRSYETHTYVINRRTKINENYFYRSEGNIYLIDSAGNKTLLSSVGETVVATNITDYYIFYVAISKDVKEIHSYRMNTDGSDKQLIKSMPFKNLKNITFDNRYMYICAENSYIKTDKETFEEINLSDIPELDIGYYQVADEKFFQCLLYPTYYIDTNTGETVFLESN